MKKILLINYYWPPCGGSAVQRWLDLTANFDKLNIQSYVVTIDEKVATFPFLDDKLNRRIANSTKIFKTSTSELFYLYDSLKGKSKSETEQQSSPVQPKSGLFNQLARFVRGNLLLPDPRRGWNRHAYRQARELIEKNHFDAVFTAGPPQSTHLIGLKLKKAFPDIHWIADLHDYWTDNFILRGFYRTRLAGFFDKRLEKKVLQNANQIMVHCQYAKRLYTQKVPHIDHKIFVLTMGYNGQLFSKNRWKGQAQEEFVITYTGILGEQYAPAVFFEALKDLIQAHPDIQIKFKLAGSAYPGFFEMIESLEIGRNFDDLGYLSQVQSIELLQQSSVLLLLNPRVENNEMIVPGKIYEYLAAGKPIISLSNPGSENEQIIQNCNAGKNFDWEEKGVICQYLEKLVLEWKIKRNLDFQIADCVRQYERGVEARHLVEKLGL